MMDLSGQPPGYPQVRVKELQLLNADALAMATEQFAVLAAQPDFGAGQVQIPNRALGPAVNRGGLVPAQMTHRLEALVGNNIDKRIDCGALNRLFDDFD